MLFSAGLPPIGVGPEDVTVSAPPGDASVIWPLFLLVLFAFGAWQVWKFSRRVSEGRLPRRLAKNWETQFWADFDDWRGDPLNR